MKPIDLSAYANRTVDFLIKGELVKLPELSYRDMKKVAEYEANEDTTQQDELKMVLWLLNENTGGKQFTEKDVYDLPAGAISRIYRECVLLPRKALNDPN